MYILLASNDPANHLLITRLLKRERHVIYSTLTEQEMLEQLERPEAIPDLLILGNFEDSRFAEVVLQDLRSKPYGNGLKIIVLAAEDTITARAIAHIREMKADYLPLSDFHRLNEHIA